MGDNGYADASDEYTERFYDIAVWRETTDGYEWELHGDYYETAEKAQAAVERKRKSLAPNRRPWHFRPVLVERTTKITEIPS
jgi:hypothetical protein